MIIRLAEKLEICIQNFVISGEFWKLENKEVLYWQSVLNRSKYLSLMRLTIEAAVRICSSKWVFLRISQYSQENTCVGVSF